MKEKCDLSDFDLGVDLSVEVDRVFQKLLVSWDFNLSLDFTQNGAKNKKKIQ